MRFYDFMISHGMGASSFHTWQIVARLLDGDADLLSTEDRAIAERITGRTRFPTQPVRRFYAGLGRRSGKTLFESRRAAWLLSQDYRDRMASGEVAVVAAICPTTDQAKLLLNYTRATILDSPELAELMVRDTADGFELSHGTAFEVHAASFRSTRGRTYAGIVLDEAAFLRNADSAQPDVEIVRATDPGLATLDGSRDVSSTLYMRVGVVWDGHRRLFGNNEVDDELFVQGPTSLFNPTIRESIISNALAEDPESARAEWLGEFRTDLSAAFDPAWIDAAVDGSVMERARVGMLPQGCAPTYHAFTDPSGGAGRDSWSTRIVHLEGNELLDDAMLEIRPPFNTGEAAKLVAEFVKRYGIRDVHGDRYAGVWPSDALRVNGVAYLESQLTKSEIYREAVSLFSSGRVRLLDHARTLTQLRQLERRTRSGGKDSIDHPVGASDDNANCLCGALVLAAAHGAVMSDSVFVVHSTANDGMFGLDTARPIPLAEGISQIFSGQRWH